MAPRTATSRLRPFGPALLGLALLVCGGCAINPVSGEADFVLMSEAEEMELGRRYHLQVLARYHLYHDRDLQHYLNRLGQTMAVVSHRAGIDYRFTVLDSPELNAFALPGGYIYVTRGLLPYLDNEAELAAVLGHEIGHVAARHAVRMDAAQRAERFFGELLFDHLGDRVEDGYRRFSRTLASGYSRRHELEADRLAVEYLARIGYPPYAMDRVIAVLQGQEDLVQSSAEVPAYHGLSSHPDNQQRHQVISGVAAELIGELPPPRRPQRADYLQRLRGLVFGEGSNQGRLFGRDFLHRPSRTGLRLPPDWSLDNNGRVLTLQAPGRDALIQIVLERRPRGTAARTLLEQLPLDEPLHDEQPLLDHAGGRGWIASSIGRTPLGDAPLRLASWLNDDYAWILIASSRDWERDAALIEACLRSLYPLGEADLARTEPWRIDLLRATAGTTYADLAADSPLGEQAEARLRLLNGHTDPGREPAPGTWIKIVR